MPITAQRFDPALRLDEVQPHPANPRQGNVNALRSAIDALGFYGAIIVRDTGHVLAGWHRVLAAHEEGMPALPALVVTCDDRTAENIVLVDNRASDLAIYDDSVLASVLSDLSSADALAGTGYTPQDLSALLAEVSAAPTPPPSPEDDTGASVETLRSMVLTFDPDHFPLVMADLLTLQRHWGLSDFSAVVSRLALG